jgi:hypothetical protein
MPDIFRLALATSCVGVPLLAIVALLRSRRPLAAAAAGVGLGAALWFLYSAVFPSSGETRGGGETATLVASYLSMVLGMMAQYLYAKAERGDKSFTIEWMQLLLPIFASPIVFIPLVGIAGEVSSTSYLFSQPKVMVYLVAFQNGFFWKHFLDQRKPSSEVRQAET